MPDTVWRRMGHLPLQSAPWVAHFQDPQAAARDLQTAFEVLDLGSFAGTATPAPRGFQLHSASLPYGDVVISSFAGTGLHSHLRSGSLGFFVLPGRGIGHYRLLGERMEVSAGATVGYLPPCEFEVTNSVTGGTLIGFRLEQLQRRLAAIGGEGNPSGPVHPELFQPRAFPLESPRQLFLITAVLDALRLIDQAAGTTGAPPPAALALDDLLLRSIALLLAPTRQPRAELSGATLQQAVDLAMAWMEANLHKPICLSDIELQVGYGRRSLQTGFKRRVGCGPMQWLRRQRLQAAHRLISAIASGAEQRLSVQQVAQQCGYLSLSAFSRDFAMTYGYPPSQLMRQRRLPG